MIEKIRDERQLKALTGLTEEKFASLAETFAEVYQEERQRSYDQRKSPWDERGRAQGTRQRKPGGGQKGKLPSAAEKLVFVLYYFKDYPTFDVLGTHFNMARSSAGFLSVKSLRERP